MPAKRFHGLTKAQQDALGWIAIGQTPNCLLRTLDVLRDKGLIVAHRRTLPGRFPVEIEEYEVPPAVHLEWCEWCAAHPPKGGWESYG